MAQITREFLEEALGELIESFTVNSGSGLQDGYSSLLYSIKIQTKNSETKNHILLKCYPTNSTRQEFLAQANLFETELRVYDSLIPELTKFQQKLMDEDGAKEITLPFPKFFYGRAVDYSKEESWLCDDLLQNCIIMENLRLTRGFRQADRLSGFDLAHSKLVVEAQAKLHAMTWAYKTKLGLSSITSKMLFLKVGHFERLTAKSFEPMFEKSGILFKQAIEAEVSDADERKRLLQAVDNARSKATAMMDLYVGVGEKSPTVLAAGLTKDNCLRIQGEVKEDEDSWDTVIHMDSRLDNMMFRYDDHSNPIEVVLLDLQTCMESDPMADLMFALFSSVNPSPWQLYSDQLLQLYHNTFVGICSNFKVEPPKDFNLTELTRRFYRAKVYGFTVVLLVFPIVFNDPEDAVDFEKISGDKEFLTEMASMSTGLVNNAKFKKTAVHVVKELFRQGVI